MKKVSSWRELLDSIVSSAADRERIATEAGVRSITLTRWVSGESTPRLQNLRQLLKVIPHQHRDQFRELIELEVDLPTLSGSEIDDLSEDIPSKFVNELLEVRATGPDVLRFWTMSHHVLQHALKQLDPEPMGMAIIVVQCMPPHSDGKIHSLRETVGLGTPPWGGDLEQKALFLGAESLAGQVVASCRPQVVQNLTKDKTFFPAYQTLYEMSAMAYPIMFAGRVAGCLLVSSTQINYFLPPSRLALIHSYANLVSLAFEPAEFYAPDLIELRLMPSPEVQQAHFTTFRQRVLKLLKDSANTQHPLMDTQAEQRVWHDLEGILLDQMPPPESTEEYKQIEEA